MHHHRYARLRMLVFVPLLLLAAVVTSAALPQGSDAGAGVAPATAEMLPSPAARRAGGKGIHRGLFELWTFGPFPTAWYFATGAATEDGGEYYLIHLDAHVFPSEANPAVSQQVVYLEDPSEDPDIDTVYEAMAWIVDNYVHVSSSTQLVPLLNLVQDP